MIVPLAALSSAFTVADINLPDGSWPFLIWNHSQSKLEINQAKKSLPMTTVMEFLDEIRELLCQQSSAQ